ncbi:TetR/AcrR family transcriptional regulator C-terminal domain-containing protein [Myxococcus stipitatus]|uniref:TetR/AcrR family transcriptional regulator C-terminal domain-containing protein n=1 Tax=Myxococcus stipitatus TaxID=83455 RepID=UPI001F4652B4|nr:TetR/AcrR family transcriptional regulator C-terminal domain-containing protein [Myxococcus stipitatus]MCE9667887.1 TetR/AcrR family transcriptional regulator C-terminal domain-containing protein [Myxococcus stipitatus]
MRIQKEQVVQAAWTLVDEVGVEGLTMRSLAQALAIQAPSLYWHFPSKQALLDTMADALLDDVGLERPPGRSWEAVVKDVAGQLRRAFLSHRDAARVFAGTVVASENTFRVSEWVMEALAQAGLSSKDAAWATFTLLDYVLGFTIEEQSFGARDAQEPPLAERMRALATPRFPHVARAVEALVDPDFDARFAFGVELLLAGVRARRPARAR